MERCWSEHPPLYEVGRGRAAACFLHAEGKVTETRTVLETAAP
jgi:hypothetical protein